MEEFLTPKSEAYEAEGRKMGFGAVHKRESGLFYDRIDQNET